MGKVPYYVPQETLDEIWKRADDEYTETAISKELTVPIVRVKTIIKSEQRKAEPVPPPGTKRKWVTVKFAPPADNPRFRDRIQRTTTRRKAKPEPLDHVLSHIDDQYLYFAAVNPKLSEMSVSIRDKTPEQISHIIQIERKIQEIKEAEVDTVYKIHKINRK